MKIKILNKLFVRHNDPNPARQSIWFIHGFADSGLAYKEVFQSPLREAFNLYVVDMPGFGVSPLNPDFISVRQQADVLAQVIAEESGKQPVSIVAHSLGALIGTWVCQILGPQINTYFSIEGNLTEADSYFSSKPLGFDTAEAFASAFEQEIFERAQSEPRFRRYYSSLCFASPEAMRNWGLSSQAHIQGNICGYEFRDLNCQKLYLWGDVDTPKETQEFIQTQAIPNRLYPGVGHWHMIENSEQFYGDIFDRLRA